jgi:hypothetical protein
MSIDYFYTQNTVPVTGENESRKKMIDKMHGENISVTFITKT